MVKFVSIRISQAISREQPELQCFFEMYLAKAGWNVFLRHLKERGLKGVKLVISDACFGRMESATEFFPEEKWQHRTVHFYRNVLSLVPKTNVNVGMAVDSE